MSCVCFKKNGIIYFLLAYFVLFSSCKPEETTTMLRDVSLKGSIDYAKLHEVGNSEISYNSKNGWNTIIGTEYDFFSGFYGDASKEIFDAEGSFMDTKQKANSSLGIAFGLEYISKGAKFQNDAGKIGLNYIAVPINLRYHYLAGPGNVYGGLGPYFAYGIGGKEGDVSSYGEDNGGFKRFDAGLNFTVGYKLNMGVSLDLGYDLGLANVEYASNDVKGHTRCFSINVGYQIGKLFVKKK